MNVSDSNGRSQDFDLNLAPIIDCFTVLITFMLASASFLAIAIFDSGVAAPGTSSVTEAPPAISIEITLDTEKDILLKVSGKIKEEKKLGAIKENFNKEALLNEIRILKNKFPDTKVLTLSATDNVEYIEIIKMMESLKTLSLATLLGGF